MILFEASKFAQLFTLHPLLKDEQRDRITLLISGKQFIVQNRQVRLAFGIEARRCVSSSWFNILRLCWATWSNEVSSTIANFKSIDSIGIRLSSNRFSTSIWVPGFFFGKETWWASRQLCTPLDRLRSNRRSSTMNFGSGRSARTWSRRSSKRIWSVGLALLFPLHSIRFASDTPRWISSLTGSAMASSNLENTHLSAKCSFPLRWTGHRYLDVHHDHLVHIVYERVSVTGCRHSKRLNSRIVPTVTEARKLQDLLDVEQIYFPLFARWSFVIEILCLMAFSLELILRIISAPNFLLIQSDLFSLLDFVRKMCFSSILHRSPFFRSSFPPVRWVWSVVICKTRIRSRTFSLSTTGCWSWNRFVSIG